MNPTLLEEKDEPGWWSIDSKYSSLVRSFDEEMAKLGIEKRSNLSSAVHQMIYDSNDEEYEEWLSMDYLKMRRGRFKLCLLADTNLCGNLQNDGVLAEIFPTIEKDRLGNCSQGEDDVWGCNDVYTERSLQKCKDQMTTWCGHIFGSSYQDYALKKHQVCDTFGKQILAPGVWGVESYDVVEKYHGEGNSIDTFSFAMLLYMVLLIWAMLILEEYRTIYNSVIVIHTTESTSSTHPDDFATTDPDGLMELTKLPRVHKAFALGVCFARSMVGLVVAIVGLVLLSSTDSLLDLILNCTALGFLLEVDNLIHRAFFGLAFKLTITDNCAPLRCTSEDPHLRS